MKLPAGGKAEGLDRGCVKCHLVALAIKDDGPESVRTDLVDSLEDVATVRRDSLDRLRETTLRVQVDEWTNPGWRIVGIRQIEATTHISTRVGKQAKGKPRATFFRDLRSNDGRVELDGAIKVGNGDVDPNDAVAHGVPP